MTEIYDTFLVTKLRNYMQEQDSEESGKKEKTSFWATESETPLFDVYHKWMGTPPTNPIEADKLVMFQAGKMMELALVEALEKIGVVTPQKEQLHFNMEREGVPISGYMDAIFTDGTCLEIKTFYGEYQAQELKALKPRTSYLKQLAIYMDALDKDKGKLMYMDRGTGEMYEFTLLREGTKYKCGFIEFDITDTYKKWAKLYNENILTKTPPIPDKKYKYDIETLDWTKISKSQISKARNGQAVIGDWEPKYSSYKDLYIQAENTSLGYTDKEIARIKELTKGYSASIPRNKAINRLIKTVDNPIEFGKATKDAIKNYTVTKRT